MKTKLFQSKIYVKKSLIHGYGVFAGKPFKKGEKIEDCYFILSDCEDDILMDYIFEARGRSAVVLGYGSLYNHSDRPNAAYKLSIKRRIMTIKASRPIKKDEEIFVNYGNEWFSSREASKKKSSKKRKSKSKKKSKKRK